MFEDIYNGKNDINENFYANHLLKTAIMKYLWKLGTAGRLIAYLPIP